MVADKRPQRRATDRVRARPDGILGRLRLRHKLGLIIVLSALLPVLGASWVAMQLVLDGLRSGARTQTERTLRVALNLVLSQVQEVFEDTVRLSEVRELGDLVDNDANGAADLLGRRNETRPGLTELTDNVGRVVARYARDKREQATLQIVDGEQVQKGALQYERRVTIARAGGPGGHRLVIRASAPVIDATFRLRGAVVETVPLDSDFADRLKAELSADVVVYEGDAPTSSSFVAEDGRREPGFRAPTAIARDVLNGKVRIVDLWAFGRRYSVGYVPLQNLDGARLGMLAVAIDEDAVVLARQQAWRSLALGGAAALALALSLASILSRRLTRPIGHLHAGAIAVARGDLEHQIVPETGDEIGDLAVAFAQMTRAVRENQERLAARAREMQTLHEIGRAVSSVLGLGQVLRQVVNEVAQVTSARRAALVLSDPERGLQVGADVGIAQPDRIVELCEAVAWRGGPVRIVDVDSEQDLHDTAARAGVSGSLLVVPLEQKDRILGMILVNRDAEQPFSESEQRLVASFADHASIAISNARLYDEVQQSSEELEHKVKERTLELVVANQDLAQALNDLQSAQAQLVHSERMAGLGQLVAGVAHEINSPAAAIQGAVDNLADNVPRLARRARELGELTMTPEDRTRFFALVEQLGPQLAATRIEAPALVRRRSRELTASLSQHGVEGAENACRTLVEIGAAEAAFQLAQLATSRTAGDQESAAAQLAVLVGYLEQYAYLFRNTHAIRTAIRRITRIVGALKGYSHLDQAKVAPADLHEGIENTLLILHAELRYGINVTRKFSTLPAVPVYVDELNQVWTNLIHNAAQALSGRGEIVIETQLDGKQVAVSIEDNGPGIPPDVMPRIFNAFFTTKPKGEGTGLGLGIVKQIVEKHGGTIDVLSQPGRTRFTVKLPVDGPPPVGESTGGNGNSDRLERTPPAVAALLRGDVLGLGQG